MTFVFLKRYDHYVIVNDDADFIVGSVSTTVPIVMAIVGDPVAGGIVTSLAQPGGNITGRNTARCDDGTVPMSIEHSPYRAYRGRYFRYSSCYASGPRKKMKR